MKILNAYLWIKRSAVSKKTGLAPILCRISYNKQDETDVSTDIKIDPEKWNNEFKQAFGSANAAEINRHLQNILDKVKKIDTERDVLGQERSAEIIKNVYEGKGEFKNWSLLDIIDEHNEKYEVGVKKKLKGHSESTLKKYKRLKLTVQEFIQHQYKRKDKFLTEINYEFIESFVFFLSTEKELGNESIRSAYYGKINKIVNISVKKGRFKKDPFEDFTMDRDDSIDDSNWLTMEEIILISRYKFPKSPRLERVRQRVVISMFTGLSYIDLETLTVDDLKIDINGFRYIDKTRQKSFGESIIPIIAEIEYILDEYSATAHARNGKLLPKLSNKCYRDYLIEILTIIGINKHVTPHKLRHSFAQASIEAGASVEAVSKMLGHKDTRTITKHYVKFNKNIVFNSKDALQDKINEHNKEDKDNIRNLGAG